MPEGSNRDRWVEIVPGATNGANMLRGFRVISGDLAPAKTAPESPARIPAGLWGRPHNPKVAGSNPAPLFCSGLQTEGLKLGHEAPRIALPSETVGNTWVLRPVSASLLPRRHGTRVQTGLTGGLPSGSPASFCGHGANASDSPRPFWAPRPLRVRLLRGNRGGPLTEPRPSTHPADEGA